MLFRSTGIAGVDGSAGTPAVQGSDTNTGVFHPAADTVAISTGGSERLRIDSSGNVGIGGTPGYKLDVFGTGDTVARVTTSGTNNSVQLLLQNGDGTTSVKYSYARFLNNNTNGQEWRLGTYGTDNFTLYNQKASATSLTIDTSSNLGIGTIPSAKLHVFTGSTTDGLRIQRYAGNYYSELRQTDTPEGLAFLVGDGTTVTERVRITGAGAIAFSGASSYGSSSQVLQSNGNAAPTWVAGPIGNSQTWQTVTRSLATTYTNSTGKSIMMTIYTGSVNSAGTMTITVGGATACSDWATGAKFLGTAIIPSGATYSASFSGSLASFSWYELR